MKKKLIIITGISGVGKSAVSGILYERLENCFYLEGDKCGIINTSELTPENEALLIENISHVLNNYIKNTGSMHIIFNWNLHNKESLDKLLNLLDLIDISLYKINLICTKDELIKRIKRDIAEGIRDKKDIDYFNNLIIPSKEGKNTLDTTGKTPEEIASEIIYIISNRINGF